MKKIATCISLFLALSVAPNSYAEGSSFFSNVFDDLTSSGSGNVFERKKIRELNAENKGKFTIIGNEGLWCSKSRAKSRDKSLAELEKKDCSFSAKLINKTNAHITALVINIKIFNKSTSTSVMQKKVTLPISIIPTVQKKINVHFYADLIKKAYLQLGDDFSWNYNLVGAVPEDLDIGSKYLTVDYGWLD